MAVALWLVMSASDCEAVPNDTTRLAVCAAVLMCCWIGGMGACVSLVRTARKSLARVLTPQCFGSVSLCLLQCMLRCRLCACCSLPPSVCMGVAESAAADWPQVLCVSVCCDQGGAIYVGSNTQVDIRGSVLSNNQGVRGGGGAMARHER